MQKNRSFFWLPILVILALAVIFQFAGQVNPVRGTASQGRLDLGVWPASSVVELSGEWQLFDGRLIIDIQPAAQASYRLVPDLWDSGSDPTDLVDHAATYRLLVTGLDAQTDYAVHLPDQCTAYRLLINDRLIAQEGIPASQAAGHVSGWQTHLGYFRADSQGDAELLIEISNFTYNVGGFWNVITLGRTPDLIDFVAHRQKTEIFLFTATIVLGLFFLGLFGITPEARSYLYFAVICILSAIRILFRGERQIYTLLHGLPWGVALRIEYLTGYWFLPAFGLLVYYLDYLPRSRLVFWLFNSLGLAFLLLVMFAPALAFANFLQTYMYLCLIGLLYAGYVLAQGLRQKKRDAVLITLGMIGLIPTVLIEFFGGLSFSILPHAIFYLIIWFSIVMTRDFFAIRMSRDYLANAINTDPLTGIFNRFYINQVMRDGLTVQLGHRLYILFIDLDKFKYINDTYGHEVGDAVLVESAHRIRDCFRETDLVCRYGGDEFIVFAQIDSEKTSIYHLVDRVKERFIQPIQFHNMAYSLSLSIGISLFHEGDDLETTIRRSDQEMYQAKKAMDSDILIIHDETDQTR